MPINFLKKPFQVFIAIIVITSMLFGALSSSQAQNTITPTAVSDTTNDDSDELPVYINITGYVQEITPTTIKINNIVNIIPEGMKLPAGVAVGKVVSLHGNLHNDDTVVIIIIVSGYRLPTATPQSTPTAAATEIATPPATAPATVVPGSTPTFTPAPEAGCNKPRQELAVVVSGAYGVPYAKVVDLHCKGHSYGEIARVYLLLLAAEDEGKNVTIPVILDLRAKRNRWRVIIIILDLHPDSTLIIFVIDGGKASFFIDCGAKGKRKKSKVCVIIGGGSLGASGGSSGGSGGGGGDHDDDD